MIALNTKKTSRNAGATKVNFRERRSTKASQGEVIFGSVVALEAKKTSRNAGEMKVNF